MRTVGAGIAVAAGEDSRREEGWAASLPGGGVVRLLAVSYSRQGMFRP
jgi:hypothetical protein